VILKLVQFLGQDVAFNLRMSTSRSLMFIGKGSLSTIKYSLDKYSFDIHADIASPILVLPILKNNDPASPIWVLKLGDLLVQSTETTNSQSINLTADLTKINIEVSLLVMGSIIRGMWII
jgi:hypothetical protein